MKRKDGRRLKTLDPTYKMIPHIMKTRSGSQLFYRLELFEEPFTEFIKARRDTDPELSMMTILMTAVVRALALRPALNRFVMNGNLYARNSIDLSITIKKKLRDDSDEATVKFSFTGKENISDVTEKITNEIKRLKKEDEGNETDKVAGIFNKMPSWVVKILVNFIWFLDKHGMMPKSLIEASPFHSSVYFTNLKSIKLDSLYHHLYDFGTCGIFMALGKTTERPVMEPDGTMTNKKVFSLRFTFDERTCDGLYFSNSLKILEKYFKNLDLLDERLEEAEKDID